MPAPSPPLVHVAPWTGSGADPVEVPGRGIFTAAEYAEVTRFFDSRPALAPTPLVDCPALARTLGVGAVLVKDETSRFGLPAFKSLGPTFALAHLMEDGSIGPCSTLVCASEGNHGRAVARAARLAACQARVYLAASVADARAAAIAAEGAVVIRVPGTYDDAVRAAAAEAAAHGWQVVSDTSWPGYERIPRLIMLGYTRLMTEVARALPGGRRRPDSVFVPGGVGGLLAAVASWCAHHWPGGPRVIAVEPAAAACLQASARAGQPTPVPGPFHTIMAGLRCGEVSPLAFDAVLSTVHAYVAIDDSWAEEAMRRLACPSGGNPRIQAGASGAAALGGLLAVTAADGAEASRWRRQLALSDEAVVVVIASEGVTDPDVFRRVVGIVLTRAQAVAAVLLGYSGLAVAMTWPQVLHLGTHVPAHVDPLLSIWRLSWIAHALTTGVPLADANIFHPERRTLVYTDGTLLQGVLATPFLAAGVPATLVYNLLLLGSMVVSAATMHLLARRLTGSPAAAWIAGTIFGYSAFRIEHYMHLELQALMFLPLALYFLDRACDGARWRDLGGLALAVVLQVYSAVYYAVFLVTALAVAVPWCWWRLPVPMRRPFAFRLAIAGVVAALLVAPYLSLYVLNRERLGERSTREAAEWSATPLNYLSSEPRNVVLGRWTAPLGASERRLFPGAFAFGLAALGVAGWHRRKTMLAIVGITGAIVSLGVNTPLFAVLRDWLLVYRGLRAPARAAALALLAVSAFAAFGWAAVLRRRPGLARAGTASVVLLMAVEYASHPPHWIEVPASPPPLVQWLAAQPRSVIVSLPLPPGPHHLDLTHDASYMQASTGHWQPMLNGYSGFFPRSYLELLNAMRSFPSDEAIAYLQRREVDLLILHGRHLPEGLAGRWAWVLAAHPDVDPVADFPDYGLPNQRTADLVFRIRRR